MEMMEAGSIFWRIGIPVWRARVRDTEIGLENIYMTKKFSDANYQISAVGKERRK